MTGTTWIVSYLLLWAAVLLLGFTVIALLRQVGVLHTRVAPMGVHFAGEGPDLGGPAPDRASADYAASACTVLAFTSPTCEICAGLEPALVRFARSYPEVELRIVDAEAEPGAFSAFRVRSTPYVVAVDREGVVRSRGVANTLDQVEEMLAGVLAGSPAGPARS